MIRTDNLKGTSLKLLTLLVITLLISGCSETQHKTAHGEKFTDAELQSTSDQKKMEILKQLDKKFESPEAHYELGKIYHAEGLWDKAEWEYNKALAFDPVHHDAQASIVKLLMDRKADERSKIIADLYMSQASISAKHSLLLGRAFQSRNLDDYALACYQQAVRLAPNSPAINKQIGYYYLLKKDKPKAEQYLRRSFDLNPAQPEIAGELGRLGVRVQIQKKPLKNTKKLDKLLEEEPKE